MEKPVGEALFTDMLRQMIVEALNSTLGKSTADRIFRYLRLDTLGNMMEVSPILHSCCGRSVAMWVESAIVRRLCEKTRLDWEGKYDMSFEENITLAYERLVGVGDFQEKSFVLTP